MTDRRDVRASAALAAVGDVQGSDFSSLIRHDGVHAQKSGTSESISNKRNADDICFFFFSSINQRSLTLYRRT